MAAPRFTRSIQGVQDNAQSSQSNPPLYHRTIEEMVEQRIDEALATLPRNHHTNSSIGARGKSSQVNHQGAQRT